MHRRQTQKSPRRRQIYKDAADTVKDRKPWTQYTTDIPLRKSRFLWHTESGDHTIGEIDSQILDKPTVIKEQKIYYSGISVERVEDGPFKRVTTDSGGQSNFDNALGRKSIIDIEGYL